MASDFTFKKRCATWTKERILSEAANYSTLIAFRNLKTSEMFTCNILAL